MFKITKENILNLLYMLSFINILIVAVPFFIVFFSFILSIPFFLTLPSIGKLLYKFGDMVFIWFTNYTVGPESTPILGWIIVFLSLTCIGIYIMELGDEPNE